MKFSTENELLEHEVFHKPYPCTECELRFASTSECQMHIMSHKGVKPNLCCVCNADFANINELRTHMAAHGKSIKCSECPFEGSSTGQMDQHMKGHRGGKSTHTKSNMGPRTNTSASRIQTSAKSETVSNPYERDIAWKCVEEVAKVKLSWLDPEGWSNPCKGGKPMKTKDLINSNNNRPVPNRVPQNTPGKKKSNIMVGAGRDTKMSITEKKFKAEVFCSNFKPDVTEQDVKRELEADLLRITGIRHEVTPTKLRAKFDHYASFKLTCFCENTAVFMNQAIYPPGVVYRWWRRPRNNN